MRGYFFTFDYFLEIFSDLSGMWRIKEGVVIVVVVVTKLIGSTFKTYRFPPTIAKSELFSLNDEQAIY